MNLETTLQHDEISGLDYRSFGAESPSNLLLLLHGVGGNEMHMAQLGRVLDPRLRVVLPRGPMELGPGAFGWFAVRFTAQGPSIQYDQAEASLTRLADLVASLQTESGLAPGHTVIAGFSQGGIMSAGLALTQPALVRGFGLFSGRILPELEPHLAPREELQELSAFISHGRGDETLPLAWAQRADAWLEALGIPHRFETYAAGHELTLEMATDFRAWLDAVWA